MKCPVDGATLQMSERQGVEIDYCPECRGVWLDRGELDKIIARSDDDDGRATTTGTGTGTGSRSTGPTPAITGSPRRRSRSSRRSWRASAAPIRPAA